MPDQQGTSIGGGWTLSSAPAEAAVAPAPVVQSIGGGWMLKDEPQAAAPVVGPPVLKPAPNANALQPEAGGVAPGAAKPPAVPMEYNQFAPVPSSDHEFNSQQIEGPFDTLPAATQAIGGGWRLLKETAPNIGYTQMRGMGKSEKELGPPPTTDPTKAMNAASDVIEGSFRTAAPVALPLGLAAAPLETAATLAAATGVSKGAEAATSALGGSPAASRFAGNVAAALVVGGGGKKVLDKLYEAAGSPEVKFGGTFPEAKAFADMSDQELIGHANSIERDPPKNYAWQKEEIAKEVINRQNARALPGPPEDLGGGWSLVRAKMAARSADVRGTPAAEPEAPPVAPAATTVVTPGVTPPVTPPAVAPPMLPRDLAGAKPKWKNFALNFDSDVDKAAYISAQSTPSKRDADYLAFAKQHTGMDGAEIRGNGSLIGQTIKRMAADADPDETTLTVPSHDGLWEKKAPAAPIVTPPPAVTPPAAASAAGPNTAEVYTINGRKVNVRYDVREDGDLTNSFQDGYPQEYQPRDTNRIASAQRVAQRKNDMNGALMADSRLASDGAPVILDDGTVITRNHGTQALRELYAGNRPLAQDYKQWITDHAGEFGLDPEKVAGMDKPVLTRVLTDAMKPEDVADFAREANMSSAARMSDAEVAQSLSKRMTGPLMDSFDPAEDGTPNAPFVRELIKGLPVEEQSVFMDAKGQISQTGARIIRNTIFAKAYPDQRALERMAESENASLKNITGGMLRAAPKVAQFQESVARGDRFDLGIGPEIADAAAALDRMAREKSTVADWKAQGDMFGRDPVVSRLVDIFAENRRSGKKIGDVLREYTEVANDAGDPKQDSMFGPPETPNKAEILEVAYERAKERWNPAQKDLFGDEATPAAAGGDGLAAQEGPGAGPDEGPAESRRQSPVDPDPNQESLVSPEGEAESRAAARSAADKLLGAQLTAQMKSGMAARPEKLKPPPSRQDALFDNTPPPKPGKLAPLRDTGQGALFSTRPPGAEKLPASLPDLLAGAHAERVPRTGAQLADTLQVNAHAAEVLRQAYERGSGVKIGDVDGMAARPEHAQAMLRGLKGMAAQADLPAPAQQAAARLAAELRKASGSGLRQVAIAVPEAQSHEHVHFAVDRLKFDPEKILAHPETRLAVTEARSRGLVTGSDARAIREVITRITSGERGSVKLGADAANRVVTHFLQNSVHGESELATLEELAHESLKDTIGKAGRGRSPDSGTAGGGGEEPDAPGDYRAQRGRAGGDGGVRAHDGGDTGEEGPELSRVARDESLEAVKEALAKPEDKDFGAKLRTYVTGERDVRIAETNQLRGDLQRMVPDPVDQQAITLMRDFKHRPGELAEFVSGSHEAYTGMDPDERAAAVEAVQKLEPVIARAQHPTPAMLEADRQMTEYYAAHLKEGKGLGFLDSKLDNDEYVTHIGMGQAADAPEPGPMQRLFDFARGGGKAGVGPRGFKFARKRDIPTMLHAVAYGRPPRTLNALDAMTIYGDQFARTAAAHLMMNELGESGVSKWGTFRGQRTGKIPADWVEMAPDSPLFRKEISFKGADDRPDTAHHQLFVPEKVADALAPLFSRNGMDLVPGFKTGRLYQSYIKSVELGMSVFHIKALNITGLNNMGPEGVLKAYRTDMQSPAFEAQERVMVRAGGESPILGRTMEAYHALEPKALPSGPEVIRALPVIRQVDHVAQAISEFTFGVVQRKLKVTDFSLKDAAWLAKHPDATGAEHFEAQRNIARQVNATYGGLHWENLGVHRTGLELSRALLLAPDWTYSNILNVGQSFEGGPAGSASRLFWLRSALFGVAMTEGMSLLLGGKAAKDPSQVQMGKDRNGGDVHQNLFFAGAPGDAVTLVHNVAKYGAVYGLARMIFNKFGPLAKAALDLKDARVAKADTSVLSKTWTGLKRAGEDVAPVPFAIPAIARMLRDPRGQYSMQDYVSTALTGQTPTHDAPPKASPEMRRLMGRKAK